MTLIPRLRFRAHLVAVVAVSIAQTSIAADDPFLNELAAKLEPSRSVIYKKVGERELRLDLFEPDGWKPTDKRSCFVIIHGGGWTGGEPRRMYPFAEHFRKLGLVGVSVQYRLIDKTAGTTPFECVKDGRSAVRYLRSHADELGIDPQKIVVGGGSAGGHVAAATALFDGVDEAGEDASVSSVPAALILLFPVIDTSTAGYGNAKCGERWKDISPVDHVVKNLPPTITFHGTGDTVTPFAGAERFDRLMREAGNRSELVVNEGGKHGYLMYDRREFEATLERTEAFLRSLKLLEPK